MNTEIVNPNSASNAIAAMPKSSELVPDRYTEAAFDDLATIGNYLPYVQLMSATSVPVQRGDVRVGNHAIFKGKAIIDLGQNVQCWVCAWRPIALSTSGDKPISFYDPNSEGFKKVREIADRGIFGDGAMCGPQFLIFIPGHGFATYLMASKTAKNEAANFKALIDKCAIISSKFIETKKYNWYGPQIVSASQQFDTPNIEEYHNVLKEFKNPPETKVELVDKKPEGAVSRE
jgi:hypothetical protein